jgi:hypothetical protein
MPRHPPARLELRPVADLEAGIEPRRISVLSERRWTVTSRWSALVRDPSGSHALHSSGGTWRALAVDAGVLYGRDLHPWRTGLPQRLPSRIEFDDGVNTIQTAVDYDGSWWATAVAVSGARTEERVIVSAQAIGREGSDWSESFVGRGTATIAEDRRIAVVMSDGRIIVLRDRGGTAPLIEADRALPGEPYAVAFVASGYAVLTATESEEGPGERNRPLRLHDLVDEPDDWHWTSQLLLVEHDGSLRWDATLEFEGWGAPLSAGDDAVWVLGRGVARVETGRVQWSRPSEAWTRGLAYADGTLALASGTRLELLDADGSSIARATSPDGTEFTTPPSAGAGRLWIATETRLYATP